AQRRGAEVRPAPLDRDARRRSLRRDGAAGGPGGGDPGVLSPPAAGRAAVSGGAGPRAAGSEGRRIVEGRVHAFFAFDVANASDLEAIASVLRPGRASIRRRRPAPAYVEYAVPPVELVLGESDLGPPGGGARVAATARLFDFGAVSVCLTLPLP